MSAIIMPIFSKPIYQQRLQISRAKIKSVLDFLHSNDFKNLAKNSTKLDIGDSSHYVLQDERFKFIGDAILKEFYIFANNELKHTCDWQFTSSWFVKLNNGDEGSFHTHNNSIYSGVYYLDTSENCGNITFANFDNQRLAFEHSEGNLLNTRNWTIQPESEYVVFFPSEVYHRVEQNVSGNVRYSLSFNIMPKGSIQEVDMSDSIITLVDYFAMFKK